MTAVELQFPVGDTYLFDLIFYNEDNGDGFGGITVGANAFLFATCMLREKTTWYHYTSAANFLQMSLNASKVCTYPESNLASTLQAETP